MKKLLQLVCALLCAWLAIDTAQGEGAIMRDLPPGLHVPEQAQPGPAFDVERATNAWLGLLSPEQRTLSDAYFEGGYWLTLWRLVYWLGVMAILLYTGFSHRLRDIAARTTRRRWASVAFYSAAFIAAVFVLELPFTIYANFVREHAYGLSNLSFGGWMRERLIGLALEVVIGCVVLALFYEGVRRAGRRWWAWATGFAFVLLMLLGVAYPVFIAPLFNDFKPLPDGPVRDAVLSLARANEIPTEHLAWFDASRQTTRISANVSGIAGLARINLNDNLLNKTSLPEIRAVMGHEMGHYVLNHAFKLAIYLTLLYGIVFGVVGVVFDRVLSRQGASLGLRDRADPAALPLALAILSVVLFLIMPVRNTIIRTVEAEADAFGLNAAREPEGFAMSAMRLSTYRKLQPGPLEEFVFYDHPSGYDRVRRAMLWRKENPMEGLMRR